MYVCTYNQQYECGTTSFERGRKTGADECFGGKSFDGTSRDPGLQRDSCIEEGSEWNDVRAKYLAVAVQDTP
jgi:hypothetical protein